MKVIASYLGGAAVLGWQGGALFLNIDGSLGGGKYAGIVSGQSSIKLAVVEGIENLGEAEVNALVAQHEPAFMPMLTAIEGFANASLAALG